MSTTTEMKVLQSLTVAEKLVHRLVLLVGESSSGKSSIIAKVAQLYKVNPINVNLYLSSALLEFSAKQRKFAVLDLMFQMLKDTDMIVFLDNIEILFDAELDQDPLRLLQGLSRNKTIVSTWNGNYSNGNLTYAIPDHNEFKSYDLSDTLVVCMNGCSTIDTIQSNEEN